MISRLPRIFPLLPLLACLALAPCSACSSRPRPAPDAGAATPLGLAAMDSSASTAPALPRLVLDWSLPGRDAQEVAAYLAEPLEPEILALPDVAAVLVRASAGTLHVDIDPASADAVPRLQDALYATLLRLAPITPPDAKAPTVELLGPAEVVVPYELTAADLSPGDLRRLHDWLVQPHLLALPGARRVRACGGAHPRLLVRADPARAAAFAVDLATVRAAVADAVSPAGGSPAASPVDWLGDLLLAERNDTSVRLRDVAELLQDTTPDLCRAPDARDRQVVAGRLFGDGPDLAARARDAFLALAPALPPGARLESPGPPRAAPSAEPPPPAEERLVLLVSAPDPQGLRIAAEALAAAASAAPGVHDVWIDGLDEVSPSSPRLDPARAAAAGVELAGARETLQAATDGVPLGTYYQGREPIPVVLALGSSPDRESWRNVTVQARDGSRVPLEQLVTQDRLAVPAVVVRIDGRPGALIHVSASPPQDALSAALGPALSAVPLPPGALLAVRRP